MFIGFKHAWNIPDLPNNVLYMHNHIFTRILRVIGGISIVASLSGTAKSCLFSSVIWPSYYLVLFLGLIHIIYITIIKFIKIIHMIKVWRRGELEVRNSPLDKFASSAAKLLISLKVGCVVGSAGLGFVGSGFLIDQVLEAGGQKKIFTPLIGKGVYFLVNGQPMQSRSMADEIKKQVIYLDKKNVTFTKDDLKNLLIEVINEMRGVEDEKLAEMAKCLAIKLYMMVKIIQKYVSPKK